MATPFELWTLGKAGRTLLLVCGLATLIFVSGALAQIAVGVAGFIIQRGGIGVQA
jgi:hypothetical protein